MSKRITAVAASALALALGCEQQRGMGEEEQVIGQEEPATEEQTGFNQEPEDDRIAQADQRRQQQQGQQQMQQHRQHQMGQQMGQGSSGQVVTEQSENNLDRTLSQLNRQLRENDLDVVATVRYDERMRQRMMRQGGQEQARPQQNQQQGQQQIGDVRLILFKRPNQEARTIESQGPEALLQAPRALLVYERGEEVIVAYQTPEEMGAMGGEEPTADVLQRIVRESTQPRRQTTAQREERQQQQQERQAMNEPQQQQQQERQAMNEPQRSAESDVNAEDQRQARVQRQQSQSEIQN